MWLFVDYQLLADAELAEYGTEDFVVGDLAGDRANVVDGFT